MLFERVTTKKINLFPHFFVITKFYRWLRKFELNNDLCNVSQAKNSCLSCCLKLGYPFV